MMNSLFTKLNSRHGFTMIEIMVVIVILGVLAGIGAPKIIGVVEKSRQELDVLKLYNLRNALNRALIENGGEALTKYTAVKKNNDQAATIEKLNSKLAAGAPLFILELDQGLSINVSGTHSKAPTICEIIGTGGTIYDALMAAGFGDVAEIVKQRLLKGDNVPKNSPYYSVSSYTNENGTFNRTTPKHPLFTSRALTEAPEGKIRLTMNVQWSGGNEHAHSVEVYLVEAGGAWNEAFKTRDFGICFSTYGPAGCK